MVNHDVIGWFVTHDGFGCFWEADRFRSVYDEELVGRTYDTNPKGPGTFLRDVAKGNGRVMLIHTSRYEQEWIDWAKERKLEPVIVSHQKEKRDGPDDDGIWRLHNGEQNKKLGEILAAETCKQIEAILRQGEENLLARYLWVKGNEFLEAKGKKPLDLPEGMDATLSREEMNQVRERYGG